DWGERHGRYSREVASRRAGASEIQSVQNSVRSLRRSGLEQSTQVPPPSVRSIQWESRVLPQLCERDWLIRTSLYEAHCQNAVRLSRWICNFRRGCVGCEKL